MAKRLRYMQESWGFKSLRSYQAGSVIIKTCVTTRRKMQVRILSCNQLFVTS